jgi:TonB-dependent starch-binding outer membrane protein SusC
MKNKLYFFKNVLAMILLLTLSLSVLAQDRRVTGKVTGSDGQGLPGVTVQIKGTKIGASTDVNGSFAINLKSGANDVLVISSIGYRPKEVKVGSQSTINVALDEDVSALDEVIVTGYASQAKKDITGAVSQIKAKELNAITAGSFSQQLQGRAAGVIVGSSGEPGAPATIRIRGIGTVNNNEPLIVIDGLQAQGPYQSAYNSSDIESIQVLKDAVAGSIYGARAGNGVIIITSKKGQNGAPKVEFNTSVGFRSIIKSYQDQLLSPQELADLTFLQYTNIGRPVPDNLYIRNVGGKATLPEYLVPFRGKSGDANTNLNAYSRNPEGTNVITRANPAGTQWQNEVFRPSMNQNYNIGISGGTDKSRYYVGLGYFNDQGIMRETYFNRYSIMANLETNISKNFKIGQSLRLALTDGIGAANGNQTEGNPITNALRMPSIIPVYDETGYFAGSAGTKSNTSNPVAQLVRNKDNNYLGMNVNGVLHAELGFLKDFKARTQIGLSYFSGKGRGFFIRTVENTENNSSNGYSEFAQLNYTWIWSNTLTYNKKFGQHNLNVLGGIESSAGYGENLSGSRTNYFLDDVNYRTLSAGEAGIQNGSGKGSGSFWSMFGRAEYSFADKYLFQGTIRKDYSSVFGPENRSGVFPAASAGWRISKEDFMKELTFIDEMKVRFGWGQSGNSSIPNTLSALFTTSPGGSSYPIDGGNNSVTSGFAQRTNGNPGLKWETTTSTNFGVDMSLWKGKFDLVVDIWGRSTTDLLVRRQDPGTAGLRDSPFFNFGSLTNKGVDLQLIYHNKVSSDFRYDVTATFSTYRNKITKLNTDERAYLSGGADRIGEVARTRAGQPIAMFYGYKILGIYQTQEEVKAGPDQGSLGKKVGGFKYADVDGDGVINDNDRTNIGNPNPDFVYGFNVDLFYKNFEFNVFVNGFQGVDIFNSQRYWIDFNSFQGNRSKRMLYESWTPSNPNAKLPQLDASDGSSGQQSSSYYIENGSFARLKNIRLAYNLPKELAKSIGSSKVQVWGSVQNALTITKYTGMDPEIRQRFPQDSGSSDLTMGVDAGNYPTSLILSMGLGVTF